MNKIIKKSPAKINIGLNVLEKRKDGFHNIETIFYPLLLHDTITFQQAGATVIKSDSDEILKLKSNIILKTIDDLEQTTKKNLSVNVFIEKNIPIGAGLGGGSSNAAITLKALNEFYQLKLSNDNLIELALKSDRTYLFS